MFCICVFRVSSVVPGKAIGPQVPSVKYVSQEAVVPEVQKFGTVCFEKSVYKLVTWSFNAVFVGAIQVRLLVETKLEQVVETV